MVKKKQKSPSKGLIITTGVLIVSIILTLIVANRPECPLSYTQAQVDASNCVIGANIGFGILLLFVVLPLLIIVIAWWAKYLYNRYKK